MKEHGGFTLLEILVAMGLMMILVGAMAHIFAQSSETVVTVEARTAVYTNARYALDKMKNDLLSCVAFNEGIQQFYMQNGRVAPGTRDPIIGYDTSGYHVYDPATKYGPADRISFIATTTVGDSLQTCKVTYELIPKVGEGRTVRTQRGLCALVRRVRVADPNAGIPLPTPPAYANLPRYDQMPKDREGNEIQDEELCHYVLGFNLEYFARDFTFSQLDPTPFGPPSNTANDPIGNGQGPNDQDDPTGAATTALRCPSIRVTLVITEDASERQERAISQVLWVPMGF